MNTSTPDAPSSSTSTSSRTATETGRPTGDVRFFTDSDFEFAARWALGKASQGTMDLGTVFSTLARVIDGDPSSWFNEWTATAEALRRQGTASRLAGRLESASFFFLGASDAYVRAIAFIDGMPHDSALLPTFRLHRETWDEFIAASGGRHLRLDVPYEGDSMPGYLLRPDASGVARPTLVITNGSDGSLAGLWAEGIRAGLDRDWNVFVFDGPGQQAMLFERNIPFRHDWEAVLTPVVDLLIGRADVDPQQLLAYGISQGGYWLGRALAFEHRFAAAAVDGGVVDVSRAWYVNLPQPLLDALEAGESDLFNQYMAAGFTDPVVAREFAFRARPYGSFPTMFDLFNAAKAYRLEDLLGRISTPTLVMDPDDEEFFPGQPQEFFDGLRCEKVLARFSRAEGANHHCQPLARTLTELRMNDFFDQYLVTA